MKPICIIILGFVFAITACAEKSEAPSPATPLAGSAVSMRPVAAATSEPLTGTPELRKRIPKHALAYLRIPNLWALFASPKGSIMDKAVASEGYRAATKNIREGMNTLLLEDASPAAKELLKLLFAHSRSPIEVVLLSPSVHGVPIPDVIVSSLVDFKDTVQLDQFLSAVFASSPMVQPLMPTDATGSGAIAVGGIPVLYRHDAVSKRLYLFGGAGAQSGALDAALNQMTDNASHPMYTHEAALDASGQGLFVWIDAQTTLKFLETSGQGQQVAALQAFGGGELKALALGVGTSGGMHRAKLIVDMPRIGFRSFVPETRTNMSFAAAGQPGGLVQMSLPNPSDIAFIEAAVVATMGGETFEQYRQAKQTMRAEMGFGVEDIFAAIGPEILGIVDDAGEYGAVRIRDKAKLYAILEALNKKFHLEREQKTINGVTYHHYVIPSIDSIGVKNIEQDSEEPTPKYLINYLKAPNHLYWREEGDYVLLSGIPQVLMDRGYIGARTDVGKWLATEQKIDASKALLLATKRTRGVPRFMYNVNLQFLQFLGDYTGRPVDIWALPTASEANMPEFGAFSAQMNTTATDMSFELSFENNPGELLMAGGGFVSTAAIVGVMAAVAIPAYQDYTIRAKIAEGMIAVIPLKQQVTEIYAAKKRFARAKETASTIEQINSAVLQSATYDAKSGEIALTYNLPELGEANAIALTPSITENGLVWTCTGSVQTRWLPKECRH